MSKKVKVYLDTSVISYLEQEERQEKMKITRDLWQRFMTNRYIVCLSNITLDEINNNKSKLKDRLKNHLALIRYVEYSTNQETDKIVEKILEKKILTIKSFADCNHIAVAIYYSCNYLLSWNFRHLANYKTNDGIRELKIDEKHPKLKIISPEEFLALEV